MATEQLFTRPVRYQTQLEKWAPGRTSKDGPPDEIVTHDAWIDVDGTEILCPDRIAALTAERDAEA